MQANNRSILRADEVPPVKVPPGYTGPAVIPDTGREVWWTGRVAIGLRYQAQAANADIGVHAELIQRALLRKAA